MLKIQCLHLILFAEMPGNSNNRIGKEKLEYFCISRSSIVYKNESGELEMPKCPFRLILCRCTRERYLTQTRHTVDNDSTQVKLLPFNFIKRGSDNSRSINPVFAFSR